MAKVIYEHVPREIGYKRVKYNYIQWLDGQIWELTQGVDFNCKIKSFQCRILRWAASHNIFARTYRPAGTTDKLIVQSYNSLEELDKSQEL